MKWKVAHACVRGSSHIRSGLPNQDAAQCIVSSLPDSGAGIAIVAVSDGHGGSRHFRSQIGSSLAVSTALSTLQEFLQSFASGNGSSDPHQAAHLQQLQQKLVNGWLASVSADLEQNPLSAEELAALEAAEGPESRLVVESAPVLAYGATLLVAAATESQLLCLQLGDGEILCVSATGETTRPLPDDERLVGNQTTSLCHPDAWKDFRSAWVTDTGLPALVLVSTDGYTNSFRSDEDFLRIGQDYLEIIRDQGISVLAEDLPDILNEATEQGSGDDITLAILQGDVWQSPFAASAAPVKPRLSAESRSALIDQVKARRSQQRSIEELSSRLDRSRRDNRRLQGLIVTMLLVGIGMGGYAFHSRSPLTTNTPFPADPLPDAHPIRRGKTPPIRASGFHRGRIPASLASPAWRLVLSNGRSLILRQGAQIFEKQIFLKGGNRRYARVEEQQGQMLLINDSQDQWKVKPHSGKPSRVSYGKDVDLSAGSAEITFRAGVSGEISAVPAPSPKKISNMPQPKLSPAPAPSPGNKPAGELH